MRITQDQADLLRTARVKGAVRAAGSLRRAVEDLGRLGFLAHVRNTYPPLFRLNSRGQEVLASFERKNS